VTEEIPFSRREKNATKTKDTPVAEKDTVVKKVKKAKKEDAAGAEADTVMTEANDSEDEGDLDDQTAALLAGFESDQDEDDVEKDAKFDEEAMDVPALTNKQRKELRKARNDSKPGVVFLG
jgi:nucleolar protein 15